MIALIQFVVIHQNRISSGITSAFERPIAKEDGRSDIKFHLLFSKYPRGLRMWCVFNRKYDILTLGFPLLFLLFWHYELIATWDICCLCVLFLIASSLPLLICHLNSFLKLTTILHYERFSLQLHRFSAFLFRLEKGFFWFE